MNHHSLLLIDDDRHILSTMADWLREKGYAVDVANCRAGATAAMDKKKHDVVVCDVGLPDGDGFAVLEHAKKTHPDQIVILMTGYGTIETAIEAIRAGAFDLLTKPLIDEELELSIERALRQRVVIDENEELRSQLDLRFGLDNIIGHDHRMLRIFDVIDSVADTKATVLITGESGTGKSMIARSVHRRSSRRDKPFVEVACGSLPENLLESELFGHKVGAFTGAVSDKPGKFLQADSGTIFLDEIATASPGMQVKLLRVLQELEFEPVGGTETIKVDVRVVLATNEDLASLVAAGTFRQDLYYRINVINVELPGLRDRVADVRLLCDHFLHEICEETGKIVRGFSDEAFHALQCYAWPGNVRELQNVIERCVLLGKSDVIGFDDLPREISAGVAAVTVPTGTRTLKEALEVPERQIIFEVLERYDWNRHATADALGINRTTLYKKMKRLGLESRLTASMR